MQVFPRQWPGEADPGDVFMCEFFIPETLSDDHKKKVREIMPNFAISLDLSFDVFANFGFVRLEKIKDAHIAQVSRL